MVQMVEKTVPIVIYVRHNKLIVSNSCNENYKFMEKREKHYINNFQYN